MRVTTVQKARKPQGECDKCREPIKAGDGYLWWKFRYGGTRRRCLKPECAPKPWDLTQNDTLAAAWMLSAEEVPTFETADDFEEARDDLANRVRDEVLELIQEKMDNIEQGFGHTGTASYEEQEGMYGEVERWSDDIENLDPAEFTSEGEACKECGLGETDCGASDSDHDFEAEEEFDVEAAYEALAEALGACPI
jgi:hypothetical protein